MSGSSLLAQVFGQAESSNNPNIGMQSTGTIGGQYQQSYGFQQQYGGNTSGVTNLDPTYQEATLYNFAGQQYLTNPGQSLGDLYASYYTGNPNATFESLPGSVQSNFINAASNYGADIEGPASSYYSGTDTAGGLSFTNSEYSSASDGFAPSIDVGGSGYNPSASPGSIGSEYTPSGTTFSGGNLGAATAEASAPGYLPPASTGGPAATGITPGLAAGISGWVGSLESTAGNIASGIETAVGKAWDNTFGAILGSIQNMFIRGMLIVLGIVIAFIALWRLAAPDVNARDIANAMAVAG